MLQTRTTFNVNNIMLIHVVRAGYWLVWYLLKFSFTVVILYILFVFIKCFYLFLFILLKQIVLLLDIV